MGDPELLGELDLGDVPGSAQLTERERILHRTLALSDVRIPVRIAFARPLAVR